MRKLTCVAFVILIGVSCSALTVPETEASLDGAVVAWTVIISQEEGFFLRVRQDGEVCEVLVDRPEAQFLRRLPNGSLEEAEYEDLEVGLRVRVWTTAPIACPGSGDAEVVELFVL